MSHRREGALLYQAYGEGELSRLGLDLEAAGVDTFSGYLVGRARRLLEAGERLRLEGFDAEILEAKNGRATRVRVTIETGEDGGPRRDHPS